MNFPFSELTWKERDWSLMAKSLKHLHTSIIEEWTRLIDDPETNERDCLRFIRDHAALFFQRRPETPVSVSELSLGSDYNIDFVTVNEGFSGGTSYKLIEIESPNKKLYTKTGKTSGRLSGAIDQILEWRRWISQHRSQARKVFPSMRWTFNAEPTFSYQIVIGRREETARVQDKIWSRIHEGHIEIISFDRLTELLGMPIFWNQYLCGLSAQGRDYSHRSALLNRASCPFVKAVSDSVWRKTVAENQNQFDNHIISPFLEHIVPQTELNQSRLDQFDRAVQELETGRLR